MISGLQEIVEAPLVIVFFISSKSSNDPSPVSAEIKYISTSGKYFDMSSIIGRNLFLFFYFVYLVNSNYCFI